MISSLYKTFQHWSEKGAVFFFSDPHFDDEDCKYMNPNWISSEEQIKIINSMVFKNDYLILLGDVGNEKRLAELKCKNIVLLTGNHDRGCAIYEPYCKEVYDGPLFIADRILISHEPINGLESMCVNIHGHCHNSQWGMFGDLGHVNVAADVAGWKPYSLKDMIIKDRILVNAINYHRFTIDKATEDKRTLEEKYGE